MSVKYFILCFFIASTTGYAIKNELGLTEDLPETKICEVYSQANNCTESKPECFTQQNCDTKQKQNCLTVWTLIKETNKPLLKFKSCFPAKYPSQYLKTKECTATSDVDIPRYSCYCDGDLCNKGLTWIPPIPETKSSTPASPASTQQPKVGYIRYTIAFIIIVISVGLFIILVLNHGRKKKCNDDDEDEKKQILEIIGSPNLPMDLNTIKKIEIIGNGCYGTIWKGQFDKNIVAIKICPEQSKDVWKNELNTFKIPQLKHDNILNFIGGNPYYSNDKPEYWLITDYHENGSLYDYIKKNILNVNEMCKIAETMVKGVRHLHSEIPGNMAYGYKPAIAHRDFKSQNVLIKSDKSACIADFGFAIEFEPGNVCSNVHVQVGTARYMAPEALEGAMTFTRDSFLRIDMYAVGLVIWELMTRCDVLGTPVGEYKHPYEEEVGPHPKINTILPVVAGEKRRPVIPKAWRNHQLLAVYSETIEECWDDDAEARLSASCVLERLINVRNLMKQNSLSSTTNNIEDTSV